MQMHWTKEEYDASNDSTLIEYVREGRGICAGMSFSWLQAIMMLGRPVTSSPNLRHSISLQEYYSDVPTLEAYTDVSGFDLVSMEEFKTRRDALVHAWRHPPHFPDGRRVGLVIAMMPIPSGCGHCAGFIRDGNRAYLMRPNTGLVSFREFSYFNRLLMQDISFQEISRNPYRTIIIALARLEGTHTFNHRYIF